MKISITGDVGSGKGTVAKLLISRLGHVKFEIGERVRQIALDMGADVNKVSEFMDSHPEIDLEMDNRLKELSNDPCEYLIDSRMAWYFVRHTYRIYFAVNMEIAAARIMQDPKRKKVERFDTLEEAMVKTRERRDSETKRYKALYNVNLRDLTQFDLVLDTSYASIEDVADLTEACYRAYTAGDTAPHCFICPRSLHYPDDAVNMEEVTHLSTLLDAGDSLPEVTVVYKNDAFYITSGVTSALAYALSDRTFVPCRIVTDTVDTDTYVTMEDSL